MDTESIQRARAGDGDAYTALVAQRVDSLYATAYRIVRDRGAAEDATQQALLDAWVKLPQLREPERFDAWLYRLVVNACRTELQRRRSWDRKIRPLRIEEWSVADASMGLAQRDELERAFDRLSPDHRSVVVLRYYLSWSPTEIADALGVQPGTVSSRLHYALIALRAALDAGDRGAEPARSRQRA